VGAAPLYGSGDPAIANRRDALSLIFGNSNARQRQGKAAACPRLAFGVLDFVLRRERVELLKRVALVSAVWLATMTIVSLRYFFVVPTSFLATSLLAFILAWRKLPSRT
jgi:hypothetical protein